MEENRFFKFLWRGNAIFLFIAGVGLISILLMTFSFLITDLRPSNAPPPLVSASTERTEPSEAPKTEEDFKLQIPYSSQNAKGYTYFELRSGTDSYGKSLSGSTSQLRNIAVFDLNKNTTKWVFPNAQQEIEEFDSIVKKIEAIDGETKTVTTGFLLTVATSQADKSVHRDLWVMSPSGEDLRKLLPNIAAARGHRLETYDGGKKKLIVKTDEFIDVYPLDVDALRLGSPTRIRTP